MRRASDRYSIDLTAAVITEPDGPRTPARILDLSADGMLVADLPVDVAHDATVWIEIPRAYGRGRLGFAGRVRWTKDGRAGIEIEAMLPHHRMRLVSLLKELATR